MLRHYDRLSQENLGVDLNIDVGQGTCTMKYSPKVNDQLARSHRLADLHPLQDPSTVQGILEIMWRLEQMLAEISGMDRVSLQTGARLGGDLGERLHDPRVPRRPRRWRDAGRDRDDDLQPPVERGLREDGRLPRHHPLPGRGRLPGPRRAPGGRVRPARPRSSSRTPRTRGSSTRGSRSSSASSRRPAGSPRTTRRTRTGSSGSPGRGTPGSTSATSTCTRRSRHPMRAAAQRPARAASARPWSRSSRGRPSSRTGPGSGWTTTARSRSGRSGPGTAWHRTSSGPTPGS